MTATLPSLARLKPNPAWASLPLFDRTGWKRMAFGDFAESIGERAEPRNAQEEIYVGLEHLDPQCLHIRRWGKGSDVIGAKLRFRKGDIIFGKRRAYQRKLAVAEFDGICSAHAMVIRARPHKVLPEFLPFLMMSDRFMKRAVEISVGSLSPTINWTTLKLELFELPPLDQQHRLAGILRAVDDAVQKSRRLHASLSTSQTLYFDDELRTGVAKDPKSLRTLGLALSRIVAGKSPKASSNPAVDHEYGVLKVSAAGDGEYVEAENKALLNPKDFNRDLEVKSGMILVTRCNAVLTGIGRACLVKQTRAGLMLSDKTLQLVPNNEVVDDDFLLRGLRSEPYRGYVERSSNGTEAKNISQETLRSAPFWLPTLKVQVRVKERLALFAESLEATSMSMIKQLSLRESITNVIFR